MNCSGKEKRKLQINTRRLHPSKQTVTKNVPLVPKQNKASGLLGSCAPITPALGRLRLQAEARGGCGETWLRRQSHTSGATTAAPAPGRHRGPAGLENCGYLLQCQHRGRQAGGRHEAYGGSRLVRKSGSRAWGMTGTRKRK